jgi:UDP-GlcNAc:undecaprenyl-phosphate GlcNAc-1-phosphate transferase
MNIQFPQLILNYAELLPYFLLSFLITLLLVPLVGKLARHVGAMDMPKSMAGRTDRNLEKRINTKITARPGGLAMVIAILAVLFLSPQANLMHWGILAGLLVLTVVGMLDDTYDLPPSYQFAAQFIAAALVVIGGSSITTISIGGEFIQSLNWWSTPIGVLGLNYTFIFPADIVTIFWIVAMINFINWAGGVDGLNGGLSGVAATTFLLIAMQTGRLEIAILIAVHLGGILGVLPFNYNPSKIFYGFGETINGYLLAVYAIAGNTKFAGAIIILGLPLLDALFVIITRMRKRSKETHSIVSILTAPLRSDRNHLHHRLLDLGYSWKAVLLIEVIIMSAFATFAFYISGFSIGALQLMIAFIGMLIILTVISVARNRVRKIKEAQAELMLNRPKVEVKVVDAGLPHTQTDDERFVY